MRINVGLRGLVVGGGALLLLLIAWWWMMPGEQKDRSNELRLEHMDFIVQLLENYHARYGAYPQPVLRRETLDGFEHVWGYRPKKPALASCTVVTQEDGTPDPVQSLCGGDVYDVRQSVIGWKGTLTAHSALNSIDPLTADRPDSPLSDIVPRVPLDPKFAALPSLAAQGFGEYVYAVRMPEDGATNRGGTQYQIAATIVDEQTGEKRTLVRGNYYVRSDEPHLPPSLIGPGLLLNELGKQTIQQERPLHVLLDGQQEGFPNPLLGEGEEILRVLTLRRTVRMLASSASKRRDAVFLLDETDPALEQIDSLLEDVGEIESALRALPEDLRSVEQDIQQHEIRVAQLSRALEDTMQSFLDRREDAVQRALQVMTLHSEKVTTILYDALDAIARAQEQILLSRDEIVKYLDGYGIEDQSRNRSSRALALALDALPVLDDLFAAQKISVPIPFFTEGQQKQIDDLFGEKRMPVLAFASTGTGDTTTGATFTIEALQSSVVTVSTVAAEIDVLIMDMRAIVDQIMLDLDNPTVRIKDIDESLRRLHRALDAEVDRVTLLLDDLADQQMLDDALRDFTALIQADRQIAAIAWSASFNKQYANLEGLRFSVESMTTRTNEKEPGVPDAAAYDDPLHAHYKGIPYPLP